MPRRPLLLLATLLLALSDPLPAQCPSGTLALELGTRVGPDGLETFQWFHEATAPEPIVCNDVGCALRLHGEDGYWMTVFFRVWLQDDGSQAAQDLIQRYGLTRIDLPARETLGAVLGGAVDAGDLLSLEARRLRVSPSFLGFCGVWSNQAVDNVKAFSQAMLRPAGETTHECARVAGWVGRHDIWDAITVPGRPWNGFWNGITSGYEVGSDTYLDYSGFVMTAAAQQSQYGADFVEDFKDAVDLGLFLDVQAFAFRSGLPLPELSITSDPVTTSGLLPVNGGLPRFRLSQPLTVRVPARAISRGDLRLGGGGPGGLPYQPLIDVTPGQPLALKAGFLTAASYAVVPTLSGPVSVPLSYVSPMHATFIVPLDATSGTFDLGNAWGVLDGALTGVPWGPMGMNVVPSVPPSGS